MPPLDPRPGVLRTGEIVIVDAGSDDRTLELAEKYGAEQVIDNPLRTGEAGKARGARAAKGEILAFVDSDNVLIGSDWLRADDGTVRRPGDREHRGAALGPRAPATAWSTVTAR